MGSAVPSRVSLLISILRLNLVLTYGISPEFRGGVHLLIPPSAIGPVPSLSGQAIGYRWRSLPRVPRLRVPVAVFKVVSVTGVAFSGVAVDQLTTEKHTTCKYIISVNGQNYYLVDGIIFQCNVYFIVQYVFCRPTKCKTREEYIKHGDTIKHSRAIQRRGCC